MEDQNLLPDEITRQAVLTALMSNEQIALLELRVGVLHGVAHITGSAPSYNIWKLVEDLTMQVEGVRGVVNRIEAPGAPSPARTIHLNINKET
jgi:osmotically-inducible protein OsmY